MSESKDKKVELEKEEIEQTMGGAGQAALRMETSVRCPKCGSNLVKVGSMYRCTGCMFRKYV